MSFQLKRGMAHGVISSIILSLGSVTCISTWSEESECPTDNPILICVAILLAIKIIYWLITALNHYLASKLGLLSIHRLYSVVFFLLSLTLIIYMSTLFLKGMSSNNGYLFIVTTVAISFSTLSIDCMPYVNDNWFERYTPFVRSNELVIVISCYFEIFLLISGLLSMYSNCLNNYDD